MNHKPIVIYTFLLFIGCSHSERKSQIDSEPAPNIISFERGKIARYISKDGLAFTCFIPAGDSGERFPVMIFFDPHADAAVPVEKYLALANKFRYIIIGSNDSKNGMDYEQTKRIAGGLVSEATNVLPGMPGAVSLAGFSGGAKAVLFSSAFVDGLNSAIYCGAAFPPASIKQKVPLLAFAGNLDMNYTELLTFDASLGDNKPHSIVEWNGKHEWPDTAKFDFAFYWSELNAMKRKTIKRDEIRIDGLKSKVEKEVAKSSSVLAKRMLLKVATDMLSLVDEDKEFRKKLAAVESSQSYKTERMKADAILFAEDAKKKELIGSFESRDLNWWTRQIAALNSQKSSDMNRRLLGYISLGSWSYSTKAIAANNFELANKFLEIYRLADPENSEQPFLKACLFSKNMLPDSAVIYLRKAIDMGIGRERIENEKDLFALRGRPEYSSAMSELKK